MGEYAQRKDNGQEVKIGTCEEMYYLRFEDRAKVRGIPNSVDPSREPYNLRFRLPYPDEDGMGPGCINGDYSRAVTLDGFASDRAAEHAEDQGQPFHLVSLRTTRPEDVRGGFIEVHPVVRNGREQWRETWGAVLPCIEDAEMRARLSRYADGPVPFDFA
jgi:hypothetical protein